MILILDAPGAPHRALAKYLGDDTVVRDDVDTSSMRAVREVVAELRPSVVVFAASTDDPAQAAKDPEPSFSKNAESVIGVAAAALEFQSQPILLSTSAVFSGSGSFDEGDQVAPEGPWAESRHRAEVFLLRAHRDALVLRFGPLIEHEPASKTPGEDFVRPVSMAQLGYVIKQATENKLKGILHVASERKIRRAQLRADLGLPPAPTGEGGYALLSIPRLEAEGLVPPEEDFKAGPASNDTEPTIEAQAIVVNAANPGLWADTEKMQAGLLKLSRGQSESLPAVARHVLVVSGKVVVEQTGQAAPNKAKAQVEEIVAAPSSIVIEGSDVQILALAEATVVWAGPKC